MCFVRSVEEQMDMDGDALCALQLFEERLSGARSACVCAVTEKIMCAQVYSELCRLPVRVRLHI